jgi:hypothetical protein
VAAYRYGFHNCVKQVCRSQFELAALFDFCRLPECISGHPRDAEHPFPAIYPASIHRKRGRPRQFIPSCNACSA